MVDRFDPLFAPVTGILVPAERRLHRHRVPYVDKNLARIDPVRHAQRTADVLAPERADKTVVAVIGDANDIFFGVEGNDNAHRSKYFLLCDPHVIRHVGVNGRLDVEPVAIRDRATVEKPRVIVLGNLEISLHALKLRGRDDWAKIFSWNNGLHGCLHLLKESLINRTLHQHTRSGGTDLTGIEREPFHGFGGGGIKVGIVKNDIGSLSYNDFMRLIGMRPTFITASVISFPEFALPRLLGLPALKLSLLSIITKTVRVSGRELGKKCIGGHHEKACNHSADCSVWHSSAGT